MNMNSYAKIKSLGSGKLEIDALSGNAISNGQPANPLSIAGELHVWLIKDCKANNIPIENVISARLVATLDLSQTEWKQRKSGDQWFDANGKKLTGRKINRCIIDCDSAILTESQEYKSNYHDVEEWPDGFLDQQ